MSNYDNTDHTSSDFYGTDDIGYDEPMVGPLDAPEKPSGYHPVNITQLVMGVAFAGMLVIWALIEGNVVEPGEYRWLLPVPWIAAGAAGLAATVMPSRPWSRAGK